MRIKGAEDMTDIWNVQPQVIVCNICGNALKLDGSDGKPCAHQQKFIEDAVEMFKPDGPVEL